MGLDEAPETERGVRAYSCDEVDLGCGEVTGTRREERGTSVVALPFRVGEHGAVVRKEYLWAVVSLGSSAPRWEADSRRRR